LGASGWSRSDPREAEAPIQHESRNEAGAGEARLAHALGERRDLFAQTIGAVVPHAVLGRVEPAEQRRVGGQRERRWRDGRFEACATRCERVEGGRAGLGSAIAAHVVGPQRVDADEHDAFG
jgi:hypothetical protein